MPVDPSKLTPLQFCKNIVKGMYDAALSSDEVKEHAEYAIKNAKDNEK